MEPSSDTIDLRAYLALAWHWAWLFVLAAILAGAAAYLVSRQMTPIYRASTRLLINEAPANRTADYTAILTSERLARTYSEMITAGPTLQGVIDRLGLPVSVGSLKGAITVQPVRDTQLIDVAVEDADRVTAAAVTNTLVQVFVEQTQAMQASRFAASKQSLEGQLTELNQKVQTTTQAVEALSSGSQDRAERDRLETTLAQYRQTYASLLQSYEQVRLAEAQSTSNLVQVEPAVIPLSPIRPRVMQNALLAAVVGLMLAAGVVFLIEALDDSLRNPEQLARQYGLSILGFIARIPAAEGPAVTVAKPRSPVSEAYRSLRTNLQYADVDAPIHTLLITSPSPQDGKSTTALNLAIVLAQGGKRVILVDGDMRRPTIHKVANLDNMRGLSDYFLDPVAHLNGRLKETPITRLSIVTSGKLPPNPSELLSSSKMITILETFKSQADLVIIDSPPISTVTDTAVLAPLVDAVLLVVKPETTKVAAFHQALEQMRQVHANLIGMVLNDVELKRSRYRYGYYNRYYASYEYYDSEDGKKSKRPSKPVPNRPGTLPPLKRQPDPKQERPH